MRVIVFCAVLIVAQGCSSTDSKVNKTYEVTKTGTEFIVRDIFLKRLIPGG